MPDGWEMPSLGSGPEVVARLAKSFPDVDLSDPTWGHLVGSSWSIELNIGDEEPIKAIMLHVRGSGDDVVPVVAAIAAVVGARAWDISSGAFLDETAPAADGWRGFQQYRDQVLGPEANGNN